MALALIVAGGQGRRMGQTQPKQYLMLAGRPILAHTLLAMTACSLIEGMVLVLPPPDLSFCHRHIISPLDLHLPVRLVAGGSERQQSVYCGLQAIGHHAGIVVVHDGVRPLISPDLTAACIAGAQHDGACIAAIPATDTLKQVSPTGTITGTLPRAGIWLAQTPQAFRFDLLLQAHQHAAKHHLAATDDAMLLEMLGHPVKVTPGSRSNIKITTPEDLILAEALI